MMKLSKSQNTNKIIKIKISKINIIPELSTLFPIDENVKKQIKEDMVKNVFSISYPVHIFWWDNKWVLDDGHTRIQSCKELNIKSVYAEIHHFDSLEQAIEFSISQQINRRNITDAVLLGEYEKFRNNYNIQQLSQKLGKSKRTLFKIQEVFAKASKKQLNDIKENKTSFNAVYNSIKKDEEKVVEKNLLEEKSKKTEITKKEFEYNIVVPISSNVIEEKLQSEINNKVQEKQRKLEQKELLLKQRELEMNERLSDKDILILGMKFALIEFVKGKSPNEIINDSRITDTINASNLSFSLEDLKLLNLN